MRFPPLAMAIFFAGAARVSAQDPAYAGSCQCEVRNCAKTAYAPTLAECAAKLCAIDPEHCGGTPPPPRRLITRTGAAATGMLAGVLTKLAFKNSDETTQETLTDMGDYAFIGAGGALLLAELGREKPSVLVTAAGGGLAGGGLASVSTTPGQTNEEKVKRVATGVALGIPTGAVCGAIPKLFVGHRLPDGKKLPMVMILPTGRRGVLFEVTARW